MLIMCRMPSVRCAFVHRCIDCTLYSKSPEHGFVDSNIFSIGERSGDRGGTEEYLRCKLLKMRSDRSIGHANRITYACLLISNELLYSYLFSFSPAL